MDYGNLIKKAFLITLRYRFLWPLGILASLTEGFNGNFSDFSSFQDQEPRWDGGYSALATNLNSIRQLPTLPQFEDWMVSLPLLIIFALFIFFIALLIFVVSTMAKGGLIASVIGIEKGEPVSFGSGFRAGYTAFWRILGIILLLGLAILLVTAVLAVPIVILVIAEYYWPAVGLGIPFLLLWLAIVIYATVLLLYAFRFTVDRKTGVIASITNAHNLMMKFKIEVLLVWLLALAFSIGLGIALLLVALLVGLALFGLGFLLYKVAGMVAVIIYGIIFGLVFLAGILLLSGITNTFQSSFWTVAYLDLTKKAEPATGVLPQEPQEPQPGISPA